MSPRTAWLTAALAAAAALSPASARLAAAGTSVAADPGPLDPSLLHFRKMGEGFTAPVDIADAGDGSGRLFIVERGGLVYILKKGVKRSPAFLDLQNKISNSGGEQGLLSIAFHPDYKNNGFFYVLYTNLNGNLVLSRFKRSSTDPNRADPGSRVKILSIPHPTYQNHNGGELAFGDDGALYWSVGDGGGSGDPNDNGQNPNVLLGKILRIDVDHKDAGLKYAIPPDNPLVGQTGRDEIWALGLRNPWRFSFDRLTADLFVADVGQGNWEEINVQPASSVGGENYGWNVMEGTHCFSPQVGCDAAGKVLPVAEYDHQGGRCSVTGGHIYRGANYELLRGHYLFGDFCSGQLFDLFMDGSQNWITETLASTPYNISTFGEDQQGGLYLADYGGGAVYRILYRPTYHLADFDGDGTTDLSTFTPDTATWNVQGESPVSFGTVGDIPVPADYDGDGTAEMAVFSPSSGEWNIEGQTAFTFGAQGDVPVPDDYDGDGIAEAAFFRSSTGSWSVRGQFNKTYGTASDIPAPGDYNNDGRSELAFFRPTNNTWHIRGRSTVHFGQNGDIPVPGDYDGNGSIDMAVFRPSTGEWRIRKQSSVALGQGGDIPVPGDYDGDGAWEAAVFRPLDSTWTLQGQAPIAFGGGQDYPLPARDTNGDGDPYQ